MRPPVFNFFLVMHAQTDRVGTVHGRVIGTGTSANMHYAMEIAIKNAGSSFDNWPRRIREEYDMDWEPTCGRS